jgi:hypothetical protein
MLTMALGATRRQIALTIAADQVALYNIRTAAGNPADAVDVMVTLNAGKVCQAGMSTGAGWASGSTLKLVNNGTIAGTGGGRNGSTGDGGTASGILSAGQDGQPGGDAIALSYDLTIDNTSGNIFAGGGQGGGGGASALTNPPGSSAGAGAGGGGGGRGYNNAAGGTAGANNVGGVAAGAGSAGSSGGGGAGGAGGTNFGCNGGSGGDGGGWGAAGVAGSGGTGGGSTTSAGGGGAGGFAVRLNGNNVTWQGGFNGTQVKGGVA